MAPRYTLLPGHDVFSLAFEGPINAYRARLPIIRQINRPFLRYAATLVALLFFINIMLNRGDPPTSVRPEVWKTITEEKGLGGRWHIPQAWVVEAPALPSGVARTPQTSLEAAELAYTLASTQSRYMDYSSIPLIVHQTWKTMDRNLWSSNVVQAVGTWLSYCQPAPQSYGTDMAYIIWDDDGMRAFMQKYEPDFLRVFWTLPSIVERADVFRVLVLKWFGGIYGDVDTQPLRSPPMWIQNKDLDTWRDSKTNASYSAPVTRIIHPGPKKVPIPYVLPSKLAPRSSFTPDAIRHSYTTTNHTALSSDPLVAAIFGIEADYAERSDAYWRAGYGFSTQLTNWALAMAPHHPIATRFQDAVRNDVEEGEKDGTLMVAYAVDLTGPVMITRVVSKWLAEATGLRWAAVTGLDTNRRKSVAKIVEDVLILPEVGFHPRSNRIVFSGGTNDPAARLLHHAQGSWRRFNPHVEFGKFCRTFFGLCRDWRKEPPIVQPHVPTNLSLKSPLGPPHSIHL